MMVGQVRLELRTENMTWVVHHVIVYAKKKKKKSDRQTVPTAEHC